jgi:hypothetical protein
VTDTPSERKIDLIEERLSGIEEALRTIAASGTSFDSGRAAAALATPSTTASGLRTAPTDPGADDDSDSAMEADLALTSQTAFAKDFLESAVSRASLNDLTPNMQSALSSLRQMVAMQNNFASTRDFKLKQQQPMPPGGLQDLPMPPMKTVVSLLKMQKSAPFHPQPLESNYLTNTSRPSRHLRRCLLLRRPRRSPGSLSQSLLLH